MFVCILLITITQNELSDPQKLILFADHLYEIQEYEAALQEYRRYSFLTDLLPDTIRTRMINCYVHTSDYTHALEQTDLFYDRVYADYIRGYVLYKAELYDSSRKYLEQIGLPYKDDALSLIGFGYARQFKFTEAARYIDMPSDLPRYKDPIIGGLLSLFPGGGHIYCGRLGDGLFSFAVVGLSSALAYYYQTKDEDLKFGLSLSAAILFYAGNIYGGVNAVRNYNYYVNNEYRRDIFESHTPIDPLAD
ncbi:hypothetical protein JXB22_09205 [candidate division WOR-3 bacterium]|nr:hypothetical protein [candidate division WOR-3 bacterium]